MLEPSTELIQLIGGIEAVFVAFAVFGEYLKCFALHLVAANDRIVNIFNKQKTECLVSPLELQVPIMQTDDSFILALCLLLHHSPFHVAF